MLRAMDLFQEKYRLKVSRGAWLIITVEATVMDPRVGQKHKLRQKSLKEPRPKNSSGRASADGDKPKLSGSTWRNHFGTFRAVASSLILILRLVGFGS